LAGLRPGWQVFSYRLYIVYAVVPIFAVIAAWLSGTLTTLTGEPLYGFPLQWKTLVVVGGCPPGPIEIVCRLARTYIVYNWSFFGLDAVSFSAMGFAVILGGKAAFVKFVRERNVQNRALRNARASILAVGRILLWRELAASLKVTVLIAIIAGSTGFAVATMTQYNPVDYSAPPVFLIFMLGSYLSLLGALFLLVIPMNPDRRDILGFVTFLVPFVLLLLSLSALSSIIS